MTKRLLPILGVILATAVTVPMLVGQPPPPANNVPASTAIPPGEWGEGVPKSFDSVAPRWPQLPTDVPLFGSRNWQPRAPQPMGAGGYSVASISEQSESPEMFRLRSTLAQFEMHSQQIGAALREARRQSAPEARVGELKDKLRDTVRSAFATRREIQALDLQQIRARLERVEKQLQQRDQSRDQIIARRVDQLAGESDDDWETNVVVPGSTLGRSSAYVYRQGGSASGEWGPVVTPDAKWARNAPAAPSTLGTPARPAAETRELIVSPEPPTDPRSGGAEPEPGSAAFRRSPTDYLNQSHRYGDQVAQLERELEATTDNARKVSLRIRIDAVKSAVEVLQLEYKTHLKQLRTELDEYESNVAFAKQTLDRVEVLHTKGAISADEIQRSRHEFDVAKRRAEKSAAVMSLFEAAADKLFANMTTILFDRSNSLPTENVPKP